MVISFEFDFVGGNGVLENFLANIAREAKRDFYITRSQGSQGSQGSFDRLSFFTQGSEEELKAFGDLLAVELPLSIFLRGAEAKIVEDFDLSKFSSEACEIAPCELPIAITPKSAATAKLTGDYRVLSEVGRTEAIGERIDVQSAAELIINGKMIETESYTILPLSADRIYTNAVIMPTDSAYISRIAVAENQDIVALLSLERPIVKLGANAIFAAKYPNIPRLIDMAAAGDLYLYLLSIYLAEKGIEAIVLENYKRIDVLPLKNQNIIIRGNDFSSKKFIEKYSAIKEPHYRIFAASIDEQNMREISAIGFFLSLENSDRIMYNSPKSGAIELLEVAFPNTIKEIFAAIESDETGARLMKNYQEQFPEIYDRIKGVEFAENQKNIAALWAIAGMFAGFGDDIKTALDRVLETIYFAAAPKGARVDYKINDYKISDRVVENRFAIDGIRFIRSAISFKLAGADDEILSLGFCESLSHFISDLVDAIGEKEAISEAIKTAYQLNDFLVALDIKDIKNSAKTIFFTGSLFSCKKLANLTLKQTSPNHKCFFPNSIPLEI